VYYDIIVVGSGIAGLYSCINAPKDTSVLLISKSDFLNSNTYLAQGGIACVLSDKDSFESHISDTVRAGRYENDIEAVKLMVTEGPLDVKRLSAIGVEFDKEDGGELKMTLEGGHSARRIVHHSDSTGKEIAEKLLESARREVNISLAENTFVYDIKKIDDMFIVFVLGKNGKRDAYFASNVVLATGGIGKIYKYTTNSSIATGDGIVLAKRLGATIKNLSYIQFHPTALAIGVGERVLVSEAVRGEGAYLINEKGERFMHKYHEMGELAPRDVVCRGILEEVKIQGNENIYLDITYKDSDFVRNRFPYIYEKCMESGIDITKDRIPVFPCQHYLMGGIHVDFNSNTGVRGLYAAGECSNTGVHGKNRLASNSLLEAMVFSRRAAINIDIQNHSYKMIDADIKGEGTSLIEPALKEEIREIMQKAYFVVPDKDRIVSGLERLGEMIKGIEASSYVKDKEYYETFNMASVSKMVLEDIQKNGQA